MMDFILEAWVSSIIEKTKVGWMLGENKAWEPGQKLKLLFAGYNGTRNTGSDVRVAEMLRQLRHVLGADRVDFSVMTQNFDRSRGYFDGHAPGPSAGYFSAVPFERSAEASRCGRVRRLDVQVEIRERADDDDDRVSWALQPRRTSCRSDTAPKRGTWIR